MFYKALKLIIFLTLWVLMLNNCLLSFQGDVVTSFYSEKKGDSVIILDKINFLELGIEESPKKLEENVQVKSKYITSAISLWDGAKKNISYSLPHLPESKVALSDKVEEDTKIEEKKVESIETQKPSYESNTVLTLKNNILPVSFTDVVNPTQSNFSGSSYIMGLTTIGMFFWLLDSEEGKIEKIEPEKGNTVEIVRDKPEETEKLDTSNSPTNIPISDFSPNSVNSAVQEQHSTIFDNGLIVYTTPNNVSNPFGDSITFSGTYGESPTPLPPSIIFSLIGFLFLIIYHHRFASKK